MFRRLCRQQPGVIQGVFAAAVRRWQECLTSWCISLPSWEHRLQWVWIPVWKARWDASERRTIVSTELLFSEENYCFYNWEQPAWNSLLSYPLSFFFHWSIFIFLILRKHASKALLVTCFLSSFWNPTFQCSFTPQSQVSEYWQVLSTHLDKE